MLLWLRGVAALVVTLGVLLPPPVAAQSALPVIEVQAGQDAPPLASYIRYTKQIGGTDAPIERMLQLPLRFNAAGVEHFGPPGQRTALAMRIRNVGDEAGSWILTTGRGTLSHFRFYELTPEGFDLILDGTYQAFSSELTLDPGQEKVIVIDFLSDNSTYMPLKLETYGTFFEDRRANIALVSGVVLAVAALIFVNFVFLTVTGYREFGWLAVAQIFFALNTIHAEGYFTIFLLPDRPLLALATEDAFRCGFAAAMAQFARTFLRTRERFPWHDAVLRALIGVGLAIIALQAGLAFYSAGFKLVLHNAAWALTASVAFLLPVLGIAAVRQLGRQMLPLLIGWASLALFILYGAIASMGVIAWLPINWHWIGPVGLFEVMMVTLALGLNLKKIQTDRLEADANYARSIAERLRISERAARLVEEREFALAAVDSQNALLHASGHDSRQVILALNSAIDILKRSDGAGVHGELTQLLQTMTILQSPAGG